LLPIFSKWRCYVILFPDITQHPDYLKGQSKEWCEQLAAQTGKYEYTWNYYIEGKAAEDHLTAELKSLIQGKVLDVGCAHGEYTNGWGDYAEEVVGYDMTEGFITTANINRKPNVRYILGKTQTGLRLPFPDNYFDVAYTKKGPTSWYQEANRIVRPGGKVILFHPGDGNGKGGELGLCFPGLFSPPSVGTPGLDKITRLLEASGLTEIQMSILHEKVWIPSPDDILEMACFGQSERFAQYVTETCFDKIITLFEEHAGEKGINVTNYYYLFQATPSIE
jgi:SAM-dependent methyltransferase